MAAPTSQPLGAGGKKTVEKLLFWITEPKTPRNHVSVYACEHYICCFSRFKWWNESSTTLLFEEGCQKIYSDMQWFSMNYDETGEQRWRRLETCSETSSRLQPMASLTEVVLVVLSVVVHLEFRSPRETRKSNSIEGVLLLPKFMDFKFVSMKCWTPQSDTTIWCLM